MRKVLLTVMMVSSLLAFNACKKDGAQGPQGPAGPAGATGPAGAAGAVGPAGAAGANGTKILSTTGAPTAATGATGDYAFDATAKVLYGPKTATAWPAGVSLSGANGATGANGANGATGATGATGAVGATGAAGTQFLAGAGAPTAAIGATGDFYFDTNTSVFYGPKLADGTWGTNQLPLGQAYAAKTYTITRGFESVAEVTSGGTAVRQYGQDIIPTWSNFNIFSSYAVTANDLIRIAQYPGWGDDREMIFQSNPVGNPGVFDAVPTSSAALGVFPFDVGAKFRYSRNISNPTAEFTLTASDITRLQDNGGLAFGYLTYAKAQPSSVVLGGNLVFAQNKNVQVKTSTTNFSTQYTALTKFNLNTLVPNFEKYKQDGKVFVKYKYYTPNAAAAATNNVPVLHQSVGGAGWIDLTTYANSYVIGTGAAGYTTPGLTNVNPFTLDALAGNFMTSGSPLGTAAVAVPVGVNQTATATTVVGGANPTTFVSGNIIINWNITSGSNFGAPAAATIVGPTTLQNAGGVLDPVSVAFNNPSPATASFVPRGFETTYYSTPALTATNNAGNPQTISGVAPNQTVPQIIRVGGQEASYFTNTKLVQVQVFVVPGDVIKALKAKGVNVDNVNELSKHVKL